MVIALLNTTRHAAPRMTAAKLVFEFGAVPEGLGEMVSLWITMEASASTTAPAPPLSPATAAMNSRPIQSPKLGQQAPLT